MKLLIIEDEPDIASLVKMQGELQGYEMVVERDGLLGLLGVEKEKPDLILLDIMLPGQSGLEVCRKVRSNPQLQGIPIILMSAKSEELDVVLGLEMGADDYVTKPFSPKILFSRVKAVLRRRQNTAVPPLLSFGPYTLDADQYIVKKGVETISLTLSEFGILKRLAQAPGKVLTRNQLLDGLSDEEAFIIDRNIDVHVASVRKKLGREFDWIETVRGVGYRFKHDEDN